MSGKTSVRPPLENSPPGKGPRLSLYRAYKGHVNIRLLQNNVSGIPPYIGPQNHDVRSLCLYYTILYYTILYYTILYYTILYYTILYYTILYYTILYYTILYYTIHHTIIYHIMIYYNIP